jgi:hypothetical protein
VFIEVEIFHNICHNGIKKYKDLMMGCRPGRHSTSKFRIFPKKFYKTKNRFSDISLLNKGFQKEETEFNKFSTTTKTYNHGNHHEMITLRLSTDGSTLQIEKNEDDESISDGSNNDIFDDSIIDNDSLDSYSSKCKSEPLLSHKKKTRHRKAVWSDYDINHHNHTAPSTDDECDWFTAEIYDDSENSSSGTLPVYHKGIIKCKSISENKFNDVKLTPNMSKLSAEYITHLSEQILANASTQLGLSLKNNGLKKRQKQSFELPTRMTGPMETQNKRLQVPTTRKFLARFSESGDISFFSSDELSKDQQNCDRF